jgi:hypothetical protein
VKDAGKIVAIEYTTLDGVFEEPGWSQGGNLRGADALLLGRKRYEGFKAAWPQAGAGPPAPRSLST